MKRSICMLVAAVMVVTLLAGCTGDDKILFDALFSKDYLNVKATSSIDISITGEGFPQGQWPEILNNIGFKGDATVIQQMSEDYKTAKASGTLKGDLHTKDAGFYIGTDFWMDMDINDPENYKLMVTYRIPDLIKTAMLNSKETASKDYVTYDYHKMMDVAKLVSPNTELPDLSAFFSSYDADKDKEIFKKAIENIKVPAVSKKLAEGKREFTIKLSAQQAMDICNEGLASIAKSEYLDQVLTLMFPNGNVNRFMMEGVIDNFIAELKKVQYVGDKGAQLVFVVNKAGELESYSVDVDLRFSVNEIYKLSAVLSGMTPTNEMAGVVYLHIKSSGTIAKPEKSEQVTFPTLTDDNTIDLAQTIADSHTMYTGDGTTRYDDPLYGVDQDEPGYTLYRWGRRLDSDVVVIDGVLMVPVRQLSWDLNYGSVVYDDESKNIWINGKARIKEGSNVAYINNDATEYPAAAQYVGDSIYVPLDLVLNAGNMDVEWHDLSGGGKAGLIDYYYYKR